MHCLDYLVRGGIILRKIEFKLAIIFALVILATGCNSAGFIEGEVYDPHYHSTAYEKKYNEETLKEILECFDNKDSERLEEMFSESVASKYDLKRQIQKAFDIYGGKSISYEEMDNYGVSSASMEGKYVRKNISAEMKKIKTTDEKCFNIYFSRCVLDDDNPSEVGVRCIYLCTAESATLHIIGDH